MFMCCQLTLGSTSLSREYIDTSDSEESDIYINSNLSKENNTQSENDSKEDEDYFVKSHNSLQLRSYQLEWDKDAIDRRSRFPGSRRQTQNQKYRFSLVPDQFDLFDMRKQLYGKRVSFVIINYEQE